MKTQFLRLALMSLLVGGLAACEDALAPGQGAGTELEFAVDQDLSDAMFEDAEAELSAVLGGPSGAPALFGEPDPEKVEEARQLIQQARQKMAEAREAWRSGDTELAAQLAEEARFLVADALLLVFGDEAVERGFERIDHIITWLEERVDEENSELLARIRELRDEAADLWQDGTGDSRAALERLILARQIAARERAHHRRDELGAHARLSIFMARAAIDKAAGLVGDNPTDRQAYGLRFAAHLVEHAEQAFQAGRFRVALHLSREAVNIALVVVLHDPDMPSDVDKLTFIKGVADDCLSAAAAALEGVDNEFAQRLFQLANQLYERAGVIEGENPRRAVHIYWHVAALANGIVFLVTP